MDKHLTILLVDDNPHDRMLVLRELRKAFPVALVHEAHNQTKLVEMLDSADFDLVITDYQLNWSDGIAVLKRVKAQTPNCPVIMFTGTGSEEVAVEAMKLGLDDYVIKNVSHLVRLRGAIQAAINNSQTRAQAEELSARLSHLLEQLDVGVFSCADGQLLEANGALLRLLDCSSPELLARTKFGEVLTRIGEALSSGSDRCEIELQYGDSAAEERTLRINAKSFSSTGNHARIDGLVEDITLQRQAEERTRRTTLAEARMAALSPREAEVLQHVVKGAMNKNIALRLDISEKTVEKHRANLMRKTGTRSVAELVRLAISANDTTSG